MKTPSLTAIDYIESVIGPYLKENGFSKHGNIYCRFVDTDIAQIIELQNGCSEKGIYDILWLNLGIRVPECVEHKFSNFAKLKKYYHDYQCNITCRLTETYKDTDTGYDLKGDIEETAAEILEKLKENAMPFFNALNSRDNILRYRRLFPEYDTMNDHLILLEEAMIYGRMGDFGKAAEHFQTHYSTVTLAPHKKYLKELGRKLGIMVQ